MKNTLTDWVIATVPRTGSRFLQDRIYQHTGLTIERIYETRPVGKQYISIARDPKDIMKSTLSMIRHQDKQLGIAKRDIGEKFAVMKYTDDYLFYSENSDIVLDFNLLTEFPFETTCAIAKILGVEIITDKYENSLKDSLEPRYMITAKNVDEYKEAEKEVDLLNLSDFEEAYKTLLLRSMSLSSDL